MSFARAADNPVVRIAASRGVVSAPIWNLSNHASRYAFSVQMSVLFTYADQQRAAQNSQTEIATKDVMRRATTPNLSLRFRFAQGDVERMLFHSNQEHSRVIPLHVDVVNSAPQPAFHVICEVGINDAFTESFATSFVAVGTRGDTPPLLIYRYAIASPPALPVFRESATATQIGALGLVAPSFLLGRERLIELEATVQTPGFASTEMWKIHTRGGSLRLCPPGHPLNP
jgi:hypothetical protein